VALPRQAEVKQILAVKRLAVECVIGANSEPVGEAWKGATPSARTTVGLEPPGMGHRLAWVPVMQRLAGGERPKTTALRTNSGAIRSEMLGTRNPASR
jgi:hypothetical protein